MRDTWDYNGTEFRKCPACQKGIPASWMTHKCGWSADADEGEKTHGRPLGMSHAAPALGKSETERMMEESVSEVCRVFGMTREQMRKEVERFSAVINTVFIGKREGRR